VPPAISAANDIRRTTKGDQYVTAIEPIVQFPKARAAAFDFDGTIDAKDGYEQVCAGAPRSADLSGGDALCLEQANNRALGTGAFIAGPAAAHDIAP
jgi:hypothetical protein